MTSSSEHARVFLNDLEAAFASQLLVQSTTPGTKTPPAFATPEHLNADVRGLDSTVRELGSEATALEDDLSRQLTTWKSTPHNGSAVTARQGLALLASAERFDNYLELRSDAHRTEVRRLARYYVLTPAVLTPAAVIAIMLIIVSAQRERRFAQLAQQERAQLIIASEARAALLRGVTHDIKNPLAAAAGYSELLEDGIVGALSATQREMVGRITHLVQQAAQTVTDLLELAQADGHLHIEYTTVDLATIVTGVIDDHTGVAHNHHVDVSVTAPYMTVVTDPYRVRQILTNLLSNAIKYTPVGGRIAVRIVSTDRDQKGARRTGVEVRDTGPGIPLALQPKVFEEFFRVRNPDAATVTGNGLGLAISRRIARLLGGDVTFSNAVGGGAIFTLWLTATQTA